MKASISGWELGSWWRSLIGSQKQKFHVLLRGPVGEEFDGTLDGNYTLANNHDVAVKGYVRKWREAYGLQPYTSKRVGFFRGTGLERMC